MTTPLVFRLSASICLCAASLAAITLGAAHVERPDPRQDIGHNAFTVSDTASPALCGPQPNSFYLSFPLPNRTAFNAVINSVFDHSMSNAYSGDDAVFAYTGEQGLLQYGSRVGNTQFGLYGFRNIAGTAFTVNGHYAGANYPAYLFYDGHPGIDYRTIDQAADGRVNVYAAADGTAHWVASVYNTLYITHADGYTTHYLHFSQRIAANNTPVTRGQLIGVSGAEGADGNPHLHFEVQKNGVPVDPYGWQGQYPDPRGAGSSTSLWKPKAYASCSARRHPDGTLITADGGSIYLVEGGQKRGIPSPIVFYAYGHDFANVLGVSQEEFVCFPDGATLGQPPSSRLINDNGTIYEITDRKFKRRIPSEVILQGQGFRPADVQPGLVSGIADDPDVPTYHTPFRDGTLLCQMNALDQSACANGTKVYLISNSKRRCVETQTAFLGLGYRFEEVTPVSLATLNDIPEDPVSISDAWIAGCAGSAPPGKPTVSASANENTVSATWAPGNGGAPISYFVAVGRSPGASDVFAQNVGLVTSGSGVLPNGIYFIRVTAINSVGSATSDEIQITVGTGGVPGPPSNFQAFLSGSTVSLSWNAPTFGGLPITYVIEAGSSPGASNLANFVTGNTATTFAAANVAAGTYFARVKARNAAGTSAPSNEVQITVGQTGGPIGTDFNDRRLWSIFVGGLNTINTSSSRLDISMPAGTAGGGAGVQSVCSLTGDFDVQADYILAVWPPSNGTIVYISLGFGGFIARSSDAQNGVETYWMPAASGIPHGSGPVSIVTTDRSGTLRLVRSGSTLSGYYRGPGGWVHVGSNSLFANPERLALGGGGAISYQVPLSLAFR